MRRWLWGAIRSDCRLLADGHPKIVRGAFRPIRVPNLQREAAGRDVLRRADDRRARWERALVRGDARPNHPYITVREWRGEGHMVMMDVSRGAGRREFGGIGYATKPDAGVAQRCAHRSLLSVGRAKPTVWSVVIVARNGDVEHALPIARSGMRSQSTRPTLPKATQPVIAAARVRHPRGR